LTGSVFAHVLGGLWFLRLPAGYFFPAWSFPVPSPSPSSWSMCCLLSLRRVSGTAQAAGIGTLYGCSTSGLWPAG